jgi:hypothetical protein
MERCLYCQGELSPGQPFCPQCGQRRPAPAAITRVLPQDTPDTLPVSSAESPVDNSAYTEPRGERWPSSWPARPWKPERPPAIPGALPNHRLLVISIAAMIVIGALGFAVLVLAARPQPVITVTSPYQVNGLPAGAATTRLHVQGQNFAHDSSIAFLLDGQALAQRQSASSDQQGKIDVQLEITTDWPLGKHTLTARDAANNVTPVGVSVVTVNQGEANTPGPNGAPPDDASFRITATVVNEGAFNHKPYTFALDLVIHGQPDPKGGTVCATRDDGQPQLFTGKIYDSATGAPSGITYQESITFACRGQYKHGQVNYTEQATSDKITLSNGVSCVAQTPYIFRSLQGAFSDPTHITGMWTSNTIVYQCTSGFSLLGPSAQRGSWNGLMS